MPAEGGGAYASTLKVTSMREKKPPDVKSLLLRLKREMRKRGGEGLIAINRKFKIMDDDGSGTLNLAEFKKAMGEMNLPDSGLELKALNGLVPQITLPSKQQLSCRNTALEGGVFSFGGLSLKKAADSTPGCDENQF